MGSIVAYNRAIGDNIRSRREAIGMSRKDLAELLGCSVQRVTNLERGEQGVKLNPWEIAFIALRLGERVFHVTTGQVDRHQMAWKKEDEIAQQKDREERVARAKEHLQGARDRLKIELSRQGSGAESSHAGAYSIPSLRRDLDVAERQARALGIEVE